MWISKNEIDSLTQFLQEQIHINTIQTQMIESLREQVCELQQELRDVHQEVHATMSDVIYIKGQV